MRALGTEQIAGQAISRIAGVKRRAAVQRRQIATVTQVGIAAQISRARPVLDQIAAGLIHSAGTIVDPFPIARHNAVPQAQRTELIVYAFALHRRVVAGQNRDMGKCGAAATDEYSAARPGDVVNKGAVFDFERSTEGEYRPASAFRCVFDEAAAADSDAASRDRYRAAIAGGIVAEIAVTYANDDAIVM